MTAIAYHKDTRQLLGIGNSEAAAMSDATFNSDIEPDDVAVFTSEKSPGALSRMPVGRFRVTTDFKIALR